MTSMVSREAVLVNLDEFIDVTATSWMSSGQIKTNSYGVVVWLAKRPGSDFDGAYATTFGATMPDAPHNRTWYELNAGGKAHICLETGVDSHEAVRVWQGLLLDLDRAFPWGGAVIDKHYGLIVGVSGFKEDEDILFARTVRNWIVMQMDRLGQARLDDARQRGEQAGEGGADRFTRSS